MSVPALQSKMLSTATCLASRPIWSLVPSFLDTFYRVRGMFTPSRLRYNLTAEDGFIRRKSSRTPQVVFSTQLLPLIHA